MNEMSPEAGGNAAEFDRQRALNTVIEEYFPEDKEFLDGFGLEDKVGTVYGMLLELNEDADAVLAESGVLEKAEGDEV